MRGVSGFKGGGATSGSAAEAVEKDYVGLSETVSSYPTTLMKDKERRGDEGEEELELGLSLGVKKVTAGGTRASPWGEYCRILTAKDFPSLESRASPRSSSASSSSAALGGGGGGAGTKRAADSAASDVRGSASPPSQVVVGWPPIRAFRMNSLVNQSKESFADSDAVAHEKNNHNNSSNNEGIGGKDQRKRGGHVRGSRFVKVNMDGDPIGRKVDLNAHLSYEALALSLEIMFRKPTIPLGTPTNGAKASKLLDDSSDFALTYEDKDGDWMLVGDVPWGMFLETVKRLRIMRTSEANGIALRFQPLDKPAGLIQSKPA